MSTISNPYLADQAAAITSNVNTNLTQNILPQLRRGMVASGGWGNSGGGIAQAQAVTGANQALSGALANMYQSSWESEQQRNAQMAQLQAQLQTQRDLADMANKTQMFGLTNQYNLGLGNLQLGNKTADQGFYTAQRGQDLTQQAQGFNQYLASLYAQMGMGQGVTNIGTQQQQAPYSTLAGYANLLSPFTGLNATTTGSMSPGGGGLPGAIGGALTAEQLYQLIFGGGG